MAGCDDHHLKKGRRSAFLGERQLLGEGGVMDAHDDSSIERNRQPTVLDNSVLASGLVSAGLSRGARPRVFTPSAINTIRGLAG